MEISALMRVKDYIVGLKSWRVRPWCGSHNIVTNNAESPRCDLISSDHAYYNLHSM